jgi:hypothetical protein
MSRPPIADRVPAYHALRAVWPTLLHDVMHFAMQSNDPAVKCGRLEMFAFLVQLPQQVEDQAARAAEVDARRAERAAAGTRGGSSPSASTAPGNGTLAAARR